MPHYLFQYRYTNTKKRSALFSYIHLNNCYSFNFDTIRQNYENLYYMYINYLKKHKIGIPSLGDDHLLKI